MDHRNDEHQEKEQRRKILHGAGEATIEIHSAHHVRYRCHLIRPGAAHPWHDRASPTRAFLDHLVVEVIRSQPVNQKIKGMTEKYVLREAVHDVVADTVYCRQNTRFSPAR